MNLVKAGRYNARVAEHAITETKSGDPQATIRFEFETTEGLRQLTWFGSFKEKALEHTLKSLVVCGLEGNNPSGPLEIGKEVSIVIEVSKDQNGDDRNVVRWVNKLGGNSNKMDASSAKAKLERYAGAIMALKEKEGVDSKPDFYKDDPGF